VMMPLYVHVPSAKPHTCIGKRRRRRDTMMEPVCVVPVRHGMLSNAVVFVSESA
jgi:hypothetical protein